MDGPCVWVEQNTGRVEAMDQRIFVWIAVHAIAILHCVFEATDEYVPDLTGLVEAWIKCELSEWTVIVGSEER